MYQPLLLQTVSITKAEDSRLLWLIIDFLDVKFMLLHDQKSEDSIRNFFNDVYELYIKVNGNGDDDDDD